MKKFPFFNTYKLFSLFQNDREQRDVQGWALICDTLLSRPIRAGTLFQLRQGEVSLLVSVHPLPHLLLTEEIIEPKSNKFVLRMSSETSVWALYSHLELRELCMRWRCVCMSSWLLLWARRPPCKLGDSACARRLTHSLWGLIAPAGGLHICSSTSACDWRPLHLLGDLRSCSKTSIWIVWVTNQPFRGCRSGCEDDWEATVNIFDKRLAAIVKILVTTWTACGTQTWDTLLVTTVIPFLHGQISCLLPQWYLSCMDRSAAYFHSDTFPAWTDQLLATTVIPILLVTTVISFLPGQISCLLPQWYLSCLDRSAACCYSKYWTVYPRVTKPD